MIQEYMSEICQIGIISYEFYEMHVGSLLAHVQWGNTNI